MLRPPAFIRLAPKIIESPMINATTGCNACLGEPAESSPEWSGREVAEAFGDNNVEEIFIYRLEDKSGINWILWWF